MKSFLYGALVAVACGATTLALADGARNPVGETANFTVDTSSGRTTSLIKSGTLATTISSQTSDGYQMTIGYDFQISFLGEKTGTELFGVPADYYTPQFWVNLRQSKHYESSDFKVDWLGQEDATTMAGQTYANCDKVHIYDIQMNSALGRLMRAALAVPEDATLQNMELVGDIYQGTPVVPALGAVKIDGTAQYSGMNVKFGADYQP